VNPENGTRNGHQLMMVLRRSSMGIKKKHTIERFKWFITRKGSKKNKQV